MSDHKAPLGDRGAPHSGSPLSCGAVSYKRIGAGAASMTLNKTSASEIFLGQRETSLHMVRASAKASKPAGAVSS